jgi:hypothetical protein
MQDSPLASVAMIVGMVLMSVGYFYNPTTLPTSAVWSDEQAMEYSQAASRFHSASYAGHDHSQGAGHSEPDRNSPEYLAAKAAFEKSKQALDHALARQTWIKYGFIVAGVLIAGAGIGQVCVAKASADDQPRKRKNH